MLSLFAIGGLFSPAPATGSVVGSGGSTSLGSVSVSGTAAEAGTVEALLEGVNYTDPDVGAQELALRWDLPQSTQTVTLGGEVYRVTTTYRKRSSSWYLSLEDIDGNLILGNRRLSKGWASNLATRRGPEGLLLVTGAADPYDRDDLGERLRLTFYPESGIIRPVPDAFSALVVFE